MAATGTPTPNIGLRRPQGTDPASVDDINYNSNLIDTKLGAVGNTSVQAQINSLNSKIALEEEAITGTLINSSITVSSAYLRKRNGIAEILLEGTANANIAAWSNLLSGINTGYSPFQSNEAFTMEIGTTIYPANFNSSGVLNSPQAITSGQKIRFRAVYFIYNS